MKDESLGIFLKITAYLLCFAVTFAGVLALCSLPDSDGSDAIVADIEKTDGKSVPTIIIDAGHGGMDGGAVSADGVAEKDINLAFALKMYALCRSLGLPCVLTREDDRLLYTEEAHKKAQDLKNRLQYTEKYESCVLFSIHQNKFPQTSCKGLQVYYSKNDPGSLTLAQSIQQTVEEYIQTDNTRKVKPADSSIYLLDRAAVPAVIVECGFLSNPEDLCKLQEDEYQTALCAAFLAAIEQWRNDCGTIAEQ